VNDFSETFCEEPERTFPTRAVLWSVAALLILLAVGWWFWPSAKRLKINHDLRAYSEAVRKSDLEIETRIDLLNQFDVILGEVEQGRCVGMMQWWSVNDCIRDMLEGDVTEDETKLIQRELDQLERRLK